MLKVVNNFLPMHKGVIGYVIGSKYVDKNNLQVLIDTDTKNIFYYIIKPKVYGGICGRRFYERGFHYQSNNSFFIEFCECKEITKETMMDWMVDNREVAIEKSYKD